MAGRGRGATIPAWMLNNQIENNEEEEVVLKNDGYENKTGARRSKETETKKEDPRFSDATRTRDPRRHGDGDENRERELERGRDRERDRERERDRGKDRERRSRERSTRERAHRSRERRSRSNNRKERNNRRPMSDIVKAFYERRRLRPRTKLFDVYPPGVTDENAATFAAEAILQQNLAALSGAVGPASFGPSGNAAAVSMQSAQTRHARRIYVGGIGPEITEHEISVFFNEIIDRALGKKTDGGTVMSVYINHERHFAFVELRSIELATACMDLDGIMYLGQPLKIRRPNDYNPQLVNTKMIGPIPKFDLESLGVCSTNVMDGPDKVYFGGLPYNLADEQVKELLQAFGPLKAFHLVKDQATGQSKGYGFCEYLDHKNTDIACEGLNNMQMGDKYLTVRRANSADKANADGNGDGKEAAAGVRMPQNPPSRIIILMNMITEEDLEDQDEFEDILDDIKSECNKYGRVHNVIIPRKQQGDLEEDIGKVYVEYGDVLSAKAAADELNGRGFDGRTVEVEYMSEDDYKQMQQ